MEPSERERSLMVKQFHDLVIHSFRKNAGVVRWSCATALGLVLAGCGHAGSDSLASAHEKDFKSASPEIKAAWDAASAATKSHDYATALAGFAKLSQAQGLSPEQTKALQETATAVSDEMYALANKGDAAATKAIQDLKKASGR